MNNDSVWYAVYTKPRWEKKVADLLARKDVEHYCPLNRVTRQWVDSKKTVLEPLFKSYVFIRCTAAKLPDLKLIDGVVNLVYWLGKPAVIHNEEIDAIKSFLNDHENVQLEKTGVNIDDKVCVITGPFMDKKGRVVEVTNKLMKVQLPSLGFVLVAQVAKETVKVVSMEGYLKQVVGI